MAYYIDNNFILLHIQ